MSLSRRLESGESLEGESGDVQGVGWALTSEPSRCFSRDASEENESVRLGCDDSYKELRSGSVVLTLDLVRLLLKILSAKELDRPGPPFFGDPLGQAIPKAFLLPLSEGVATGDESSDDTDMLQLSRGYAPGI